jgi:rare lipoprotein A (peptidoglycan hydrolase)
MALRRKARYGLASKIDATRAFSPLAKLSFAPRILKGQVFVACLLSLALVSSPAGASAQSPFQMQAKAFLSTFPMLSRAAVQANELERGMMYSAAMSAAIRPNPQPVPLPAPPLPATPPPAAVPSSPPAPAPVISSPPPVESGASAFTYGIATWYGGSDGFNLGDGMADGTAFNPDDPTIVASNYWPLGTRLLVCHGDRCIEVCVRDRGAFRHALDLSRAAFALLSPLSTGVIDVAVQRIP